MNRANPIDRVLWFSQVIDHRAPRRARHGALRLITERWDGMLIEYLEPGWSRSAPRVSICLDGRNYHQRLFIGGVDLQEDRRPDVQFVLNLGEDASKWVGDEGLHPDDRWVNKGEGVHGMSVAEIIEESGWVVERLSAGKRVLVHCLAGMNRSATICCGVLILLEDLTAEAALERVRQQHPWARPDPFHWINLRWLAHTRNPPE